MPATTAQALITNAFDDIGVFSQGASIPSVDSQGALRRLNLMMGALQLQPLTQPVLTRFVQPIIAGQGGPSNPYTIGPGGTFNTTRPIALFKAGILINAATPLTASELRRDILTEDAWTAIVIKEYQSAQFTAVYYDPTFSGDLGTINLYPVPLDTTTSLVLYWREPLVSFADLTTQYFLPPGCEEALEWNLARRLITPYAVTDQEIVEDVKAMARESLGNFKRGNARLTDLPTDPALTHDRRNAYNIITGEGG